MLTRISFSKPFPTDSACTNGNLRVRDSQKSHCDVRKLTTGSQDFLFIKPSYHKLSKLKLNDFNYVLDINVIEVND